jgi:GH25 family lysozyme M1 (1,4-beta-N-acetylmuramidase)
LTKIPHPNRQLLAKIVAYVQDTVGTIGYCTMGQIEEELQISISKQYWLYRSYGDYYPSIELKRGRWRGTNYSKTVEVVPSTSQQLLSSEGV